jgi:hypothetical protein
LAAMALACFGLANTAEARPKGPRCSKSGQGCDQANRGGGPDCCPGLVCVLDPDTGLSACL